MARPSTAWLREDRPDVAVEKILDGAEQAFIELHYSFMGSTVPQRMEPAATEVSKLLLGDNVNLVLLIPV